MLAHGDASVPPALANRSRPILVVTKWLPFGFHESVLCVYHDGDLIRKRGNRSPEEFEKLTMKWRPRQELMRLLEAVRRDHPRSEYGDDGPPGKHRGLELFLDPWIDRGIFVVYFDLDRCAPDSPGSEPTPASVTQLCEAVRRADHDGHGRRVPRSDVDLP